MSEDLASRLLEAITGVENHAKKDLWCAQQATQGKWMARYGENLGGSWLETESTPIAKFDSPQHQADLMVASRFKPANVIKRAQAQLRRCRADRKIVELHRTETQMCAGDRDLPESWHDLCKTCGSGEPFEYPVTWPCPTLVGLAQGYGLIPEEDG